VVVNGSTIEEPPLRGGFGDVCRGHNKALRDIQERNEIGKAKEVLKRNGWAKHASPFWQLKWMQEDFYKCFGLDLLHVEYLGLARVSSFYLFDIN
jgi:hypothetical protein